MHSGPLKPPEAYNIDTNGQGYIGFAGLTQYDLVCILLAVVIFLILMYFLLYKRNSNMILTFLVILSGFLFYMIKFPNLKLREIINSVHFIEYKAKNTASTPENKNKYDSYKGQGVKDGHLKPDENRFSNKFGVRQK